MNRKILLGVLKKNEPISRDTFFALLTEKDPELTDNNFSVYISRLKSKNLIKEIDNELYSKDIFKMYRGLIESELEGKSAEEIKKELLIYKTIFDCILHKKQLIESIKVLI